MASLIKLVVGLGNSEKEYQSTLHNIGHDVINALLRDLPKRRVPLEKSEGFMNSSGLSVKKFADRYNCDPSELLIVCDDLDLPMGQPRIRLDGSSGGHRGLESIFEAFGGRNDIPRLRIGIGHPPNSLNPAEYVLKDTKDFVEAAVIINRGALVVRMAIDDGLEKAMNTF